MTKHAGVHKSWEIKKRVAHALRLGFMDLNVAMGQGTKRNLALITTRKKVPEDTRTALELVIKNDDLAKEVKWRVAATTVRVMGANEAGKPRR